LILGLARGDIIYYENDVVYPEHPVYLALHKFSPKDAPHWSPGNGQSTVDLSKMRLTLANCHTDGESNPALASNPACKETLFEIFIFKAEANKFWMDFWPNRDFCCTADAVTRGDCIDKERGHMITPRDANGNPLLVEANMGSVQIAPGKDQYFGQTTSSFGTMNVRDTGLYVVLMGSCSSDASPVSIDGYASSMDPYGYVPADLFGKLTFFGVLLLLYLFVTICWVAVCLINRNDLLTIQHWITAVLIMGLLECALVYMHFMYWNWNGTKPVALTVLGFFFAIGKRTLSRALVLMVCMGYGVTRHDLGRDKVRIFFLGAVYAICSLIYTFVTLLPDRAKSTSQSQRDALPVVSFILLLVDCTFYYWTFLALRAQISALSSKRQQAKLLLYKRFRNALVASLVLSFCWNLYASLLWASDPAEKHWQLAWTADALWECTYIAIFCIVAYLWAPSKNSRRYAYSIELTQMDDDGESEAMDVEFGQLEEDDDIFFDADGSPSPIKSQ
jgi:hypothetical protein